MKLKEKLERLKAIRIVKTMITSAILSEFILIGYVVCLPLSMLQKVVTLILAGAVVSLALIAEDHLDKESYLDELQKLVNLPDEK